MCAKDLKQCVNQSKSYFPSDLNDSKHDAACESSHETQFNGSVFWMGK